MRGFFFLAPPSLSKMPRAATFSPTPAERVPRLNAASHGEYLRQHPDAMVAYGADWCGATQKFLPQLEEAGVQLRAMGGDAPGSAGFAFVECTGENEAFCEEQGIEAYPTIYKYSNGARGRQYQGSRAPKALLRAALGSRRRRASATMGGGGGRVASPAVSNLTPDTFQDYVREHPNAMVRFAATWCGHCKKLAPEWEAAEAAVRAAEKDGTLPSGSGLGSIECGGEYQPFCAAQGVEGYPTIRQYAKGVRGDYEGPRVADSIIASALAQQRKRKTRGDE